MELTAVSGARASMPSQGDFVCHTPKLPLEVLQIIFALLDRKSVERSAWVCREWRAAVIDLEMKQRWTSIPRLVRFLCEHLPGDNFASQREELQSVLEKRGDLCAQGLRDIALGAPLKDKLASALRALRPADIDGLRFTCPFPLPLAFLDFFRLAKAYALKKKMQESEGYDAKTVEGSMAARLFGLSCRFPEAIVCADSIPDRNKREKAFLSVASFAVRHPTDAFAISAQMDKDASKMLVLCRVVAVLAERREIDQALGFIELVSKKSYKSKALYVLAVNLLRGRGGIDQALVHKVLEIVGMIEVLKVTDKARFIVGKQMALRGFIESAETAFHHISDATLMEKGFEHLRIKYGIE